MTPQRATFIACFSEQWDETIFFDYPDEVGAPLLHLPPYVRF